MVTKWTFWIAFGGVLYAYAGYPLVLELIARVRRQPRQRALVPPLPDVSMIVPVHNELSVIHEKLENTRRLSYPAGQLEVVFVSDGSTDGTSEAIRKQQDSRIRLVELKERGGKAAALNVGLRASNRPIVVFSDASIMLAPDALEAIVSPFDDPEVGCVSGEDRIEGGGGEGLYGRYELFLRRRESEVHSIVGASGSFYAQRRELCEAFVPGAAPDFLSVLRTVENGSRALTEPSAVGKMSALENPSDEFRRKVRTVLRGLTTLWAYRRLLNPFRYGLFAFELLSHKVARWLVPFFLLALLVSNILLAAGSSAYATFLAAQLAFYGVALLAFRGPRRLASWRPLRIPVYFTTVNVATLSAWIKFALGTRQEFWSPSRR